MLQTITWVHSITRMFVLGAGFSKAVCSRMPTLAELGDSVSSALGRLERRHESYAENIEHLLTYLVSSKPWLGAPDRLRDEALFLDASVEIARVFEGIKVSETDGAPWLDLLVAKWIADEARVITLNYDLIVEEAVSRQLPHSDRYLLYPVPITPLNLRVGGIFGGGPVKLLQLCKLHGSINWLYSGSAAAAGETISPPEPKDALGGDKVPLIAPPVFDKSVYFRHESLLATWRSAEQALKGAGRVIFMGYSLPPTDRTMCWFFQDSCRRRASVVVVDKRCRSPGALRDSGSQDAFSGFHGGHGGG